MLTNYYEYNTFVVMGGLILKYNNVVTRVYTKIFNNSDNNRWP